MAIRAILWDFGDTLADERWMLAPMPNVPSWPDVYREFSAEADLADRWNSGGVNCEQIAESLASRLDVDVAQVRSHMEDCCRNVSFFPLIREFSARCGLPQAIVTINPDLFSTVVAPHYRLTSRYSPIITSWQSCTLDKAALCDIALSKWGNRYSREECLLIDNKLEHVAAWRTKGGVAFHFQNERECRDRISALVGL